MLGKASEYKRAGSLVAVVVTHNRLDKLRVTVARLLDSPPVLLDRLVVVDNACTDGTADWLSQQSDARLTVLRCDKNIGGAGGFEAGLRAAVADYDPDWVLLMDDDGRPDPGALADFHALDLSDWDAVAAAVYYPTGEICDMNRPSRNPFGSLSMFLRTLFRLGARDGFHLGPADYAIDAPPRAVEITSFVGLFLSRQAIALAGYPDPSLFLYADDGLYAFELNDRGGRIGFHPQVRFEHDCSTFAGRSGRFVPLWKSYYYHRNLLMLYRRAAGWMFVPLLMLVVPKWILKLRFHTGSRSLYLRLLGIAVWHGLRGRTGTDHNRLLVLTGENDKPQNRSDTMS